MMKKVISGGQTGTDTIALQTAKFAGIPTGGTAPKNWITEDGPAPNLVMYGLVQAPVEGYPYRTAENIKNSDGTVIFGKLTSPGSILTIDTCRKYKKLLLKNPATGDDLIEWILDNEIKVLNVAGNRLSKLTPFKTIEIQTILLDTFEYFAKKL